LGAQHPSGCFQEAFEGTAPFRIFSGSNGDFSTHQDVFRKQLREQHPSGCFLETSESTAPIRMFSGNN
jgi:hypothetical protein